MKRIFFPFIIIMAFFASCQDGFLDRAPYSSVASENMWATDNLTDMGVLGIYNQLRSIPTYAFDELAFTGQARGSVGLLSGTTTASGGGFSSLGGDFGSMWMTLYTGVHRANDAIVNIPTKSPSTPDKKARLVAESKFLRAYFYMYLNKLYKGVPLYLEPITDDECIKTQETEAKIWEVIIEDLTDCINEPNLPAKYASGNGSYGRVTKGAAYALRGKAYLYQGMWELAAADFQKVSESGYSLFQGGYKELFKEANEQCNEMIFTLQFIGVARYGYNTQFYCGTRSSFGSCWNSYLVAPNLVDLYENKDGSAFKWSDYLPGYDQMSVEDREVFFLRNSVDADIKKAVDTRLALLSADAKAKYLSDGNEERILTAYSQRDPRLAINVITPYSEYKGALSGAEHVVTSRWPYINEVKYHDLRTDCTPFFYYLYRKYVYEGVGEIPSRDQCPTDIPLIRYADILLMWAEALVEQNKLSDAVEKVNLVRTRSGVAMPAITYTSQADLRDKVRNERRKEFPNEGINFFDEMRWKTWKDTKFGGDNPGIKQIWGFTDAQYKWLGDQLYTWPVSPTEIERNPNLIPTQGWVY